jgi:Uma2 family endonuclease
MVTTISAPDRQEVANASIVLRGVSWLTFKALMADVGDDRAWRIAYDQGVLEIRMPLLQHEVPKGMIEDFVTTMADELEIEVLKAGALTLDREDLTRAIEPDTCFYIQNEAIVRGLEKINLPVNPPPDLAVESDYTNSSVNKQSIYAAFGVPEIWRYKNNTLLVYRLEDGKYEQCDRSGAFPFLPISEVPGFIEQSKTIGQRSAVRAFRERIREILRDRS